MSKVSYATALRLLRQNKEARSEPNPLMITNAKIKISSIYNRSNINVVSPTTRYAK